MWAVPEAVLKKTLFPIGDLTKPEVRALAESLQLPNAKRPDSQGLCFLGPISMETMLERELTLVPGEVVDLDGRVVGKHRGAASYTLGQRHGFELDAQTPNSPIHYVVAKDISHNQITVSTERMPPDATTTSVELGAINKIGAVDDGPCLARFRYRQTLIPAQLQGETVLLDEPHYVPEGQSLVLYRDNRCLGGGVIVASTLIKNVDNG